MAPDAVRIFEVEPAFLRFVAEDDREQAQRLVVPVLELERGPCRLRSALAQRGAFGAVVLDGLLVQRLRVGNHTTMYLEGPGDVVGRIDAPVSALVADRGARAAEGTQIALLGREIVLAIQRFPLLAAGLSTRCAEQAERRAVQLAICQLPRVDERLLALLWWLAEFWGRVTTAGTVLPLAMTHDVLGALVGARRPTVTIALGELSARGAIARQDQGWLLIESPPAPERPVGGFDDPTIIVNQERWRAIAGEEDRAAEHAELLETVHRLQDEHRATTAAVQERLRLLREQRDTMAARRAQRRVNRRPAPSSE